MMCLARETYPSFLSLTPPELTASAFERSEELRSGAHVAAPRPNSRCLKLPFVKGVPKGESNERARKARARDAPRSI
jgi:hypothetical protein